MLMALGPKLYQARASGRPQYLMRGDGAQIRNGVGKVIDVDITVKRTGKPSGGSYFSVFSALL